MITPKFNITQDSEYIHLVINAPHVKAQQVDILAEQNEFRFHVAPYFLRLKLPGNILEDDRSSAKYDISSGDFKITLPKETPGEFFEDLDLLSKLLARKSDLVPNSSVGASKGLIEVLSSTSVDVPPSELLQDEELDWELPQEAHVEPIIVGKVGYGFNSSYSGYFDHVQETPNEINEIPNPETTSYAERRKIRLELEDEKFDADYYLGDLSAENEEELQAVFKYKTTWAKILRDIQKGGYTGAPQSTDKVPPKVVETEIPQDLSISGEHKASNSTKALVQDISGESVPAQVNPSLARGSESPLNIKSLEERLDGLLMNQGSTNFIKKLHPLLEFTEKEKSAMLTLPRKEYVLDKQESRAVYLGLVDLILSYSYELRITQGDFSVESSWTIGKLCSSMACLERFSSLTDVLVAHRRRALSYPLYRHFRLGEKVVQDTYILFKLGRRALLKALLQLKDLFDHHDVHYRYSKIILDDYCVWIQVSARDEILRSLGQQIRDTVITPASLGWDLDELNVLIKESAE